MKLIEVNRTPSRRQLRQFGLACLLALPLIAWLGGSGNTTLGWTATIGLLIAITGLARPEALKPIFVVLSYVVAPIGMLVGEILMVLVYFLVFLPIGLLFRLFRVDPLERRIDRSAKTYWQRWRGSEDVTSYFRQS